MHFDYRGFWDSWHPDIFTFSLFFHEIGRFARIHTARYDAWLGENGEDETIVFQPYYLQTIYAPYFR